MLTCSVGYDVSYPYLLKRWSAQYHGAVQCVLYLILCPCAVFQFLTGNGPDCPCKSSVPFHFRMKNVLSRTTAKLLKSASLHACIFQTATTKQAGAKALLKLSNPGTKSLLARVRLGATKACVEGDCPNEKEGNSESSQACVWQRLDVTAAVLDVIRSAQESINLVGRLVNRNGCRKNESAARQGGCFSWKGGRLHIPLQLLPFLVVRYERPSRFSQVALRMVQHAPQGNVSMSCKAASELPHCKVKKAINKLDRKEPCAVHGVEVNVRHYEMFTGDIVVLPRAFTIRLCAGWCPIERTRATPINKKGNLMFVRERLGVQRCRPTAFGEIIPRNVTIDINKAGGAERITESWLQQDPVRCTCSVLPRPVEQAVQTSNMSLADPTQRTNDTSSEVA